MKSVSRHVYLALTISFLLTGVIFIFYLSWLPDPMLSKYDLLPDWLARWTDAQENDTLRTAVPFVGLGLLTGSYLAAIGSTWRWWLYNWVGLILIVLIAEIGQLALPYRIFDWNDVAWGIIGSLAGLFCMSFLFIIIRLLTRKYIYMTTHFLKSKRA